jgi:hypothetical protein
LNEFLHSINKVESPMCRLCGGNQVQNVAHILFFFTRLDSDRQAMWSAIGKKVTNTRRLLGEQEMARNAAALVLKARVLHQFRLVNVD